MKAILLITLVAVAFVDVTHGRPQRLVGGLVGDILDPTHQHQRPNQGGLFGYGLLRGPGVPQQQARQPAPAGTAPAAQPHQQNPNILGAIFPGSASAGGAGHGSVSADRVATGTGTGIAQAGPGGFGIGLGVGGAIATPIGDYTFGQGQSVALGK